MQTLSSLFMLWQVSPVGTATRNLQSSFYFFPQAGEQVSSHEKAGCAACFGLGKCTWWEEGCSKALPLLLWLKLWGRTCFQSHFWGRLVPAPCCCAPLERSPHPRCSLRVLLSSQGSQINPEATGPNLWGCTGFLQGEDMLLAFPSRWALPRLYLHGWWSDEGPTSRSIGLCQAGTSTRLSQTILCTHLASAPACFAASRPGYRGPVSCCCCSGGRHQSWEEDVISRIPICSL